MVSLLNALESSELGNVGLSGNHPSFFRLARQQRKLPFSGQTVDGEVTLIEGQNPANAFSFRDAYQCSIRQAHGQISILLQDQSELPAFRFPSSILLKRRPVWSP